MARYSHTMAIEFDLFGIPTRVQLWFFLTALFLGRGREPVYLATWIIVVLVGVLLHELGHAFAGRRFGFDPRIELYAFGGVTSWRVSRRITPWRELLISAAGPAVGIVTGTVAIVALLALEPAVGSPASVLLWDVIWVNLGWAIINLLPVLPLDGGNIATSLAEMVWHERGRRVARVLSLVITCALIGLALLLGQLWMAILAGVLAFSNWQALQAERSSWHPTAPARSAVQPELERLAEAFNRKRWNDVVASAERLGSHTDSSEIRNHALYYLVWARLELGEVEAARSALETLPADALDPSLLGRLLIAEGRHAEALEPLQAAMSAGHDPAVERAWTEAVVTTRSWPAALSVVGRSATSVSLEALATLERGAHAAADFTAAAELAMVRFARRPGAEVAIDVARHLSRGGRPDEAIRWVEKAISKNLRDPSVLDSDPDLEAARQLPAYQAVRDRMNR
jgi:Zn-dependent protease/thioredoxin-like negative regulator of GroEL